MGASIHCHLEVFDGDKWYHWSAPCIYRDSIFFDLVAEIYGKLDSIVPLRGLPDDMSEVTKICYEQDKESYYPHHEGWLSAQELDLLQLRLVQYYKKIPTKNPREYDLEDHYFHTYIHGNSIVLHQGWEDARFIFWFDN